jgi:hypothetical protein
MLDCTEDKQALDQCFKWGWLHATTDGEGATWYIFTTPLHQWFVEYYLGTRVPDSTRITNLNLLAFVIRVIREFSPLQLSAPRRIGASSKQRPPEAQFQDEFYRCCHMPPKGSLIMFPQFGGASGKVDFYIPLKNWGVELLHDGDRLDSHSSRFTGTGAYTGMAFSDYVILDFRMKEPQTKHPG